MTEGCRFYDLPLRHSRPLSGQLLYSFCSFAFLYFEDNKQDETFQLTAFGCLRNEKEPEDDSQAIAQGSVGDQPIT